MFQTACLRGYHWYKGQNMSFGCMLCLAIRSLTPFEEEHECHINSQQLWSHLVKFTMDVTVSTPFFFSSFIPSRQQANRRVLCENMSQQTGNHWATKTIYRQNPSISLLANTTNLVMMNITDQKQTKENAEYLVLQRGKWKELIEILQKRDVELFHFSCYLF